MWVCSSRAPAYRSRIDPGKPLRDANPAARYHQIEAMRRSARWLLPVLIGIVLASCGPCGGDGDENGDGGLSSPNDAGGRTTVTIWHSMSSPLNLFLQNIIDDFNASQDEYRVEAIYQGSYSESLTKLINSINSDDVPSIIQLNDTATQIMIDSEEVKPIQDFIDEEQYDLSDFEPKAIAYYTQNDVLYSMPFNLAGPILYYDRADFEEVGLDPDRPPRTLDEVRAYSERLTKRNAQGEVTRSGIALTISPWFFEQMLAKQGALYANSGNGRDGRATEALFAGQEGRQVFGWWDEMVDSGLGYNAGRQGFNAMLTLVSDRSSMAIESTAALGGAVAALAVANVDPARLGTGAMPAPEGEDGGIVLGGASLWVLDRSSEDEQQGAWEFIKFALTPEQQAQWHADSGYFPVRVSAYELPPAVARREQFPQFTTAVDQLHDSPDNRATQGALLGKFDEIRDRITQAFERMLAGDVDPGQELDSAAQDANEIMADYNRTVPDS
jgi:sn-glycerol 3-phosphate transport system substrate-binding protein